MVKERFSVIRGDKEIGVFDDRKQAEEIDGIYDRAEKLLSLIKSNSADVPEALLADEEQLFGLCKALAAQTADMNRIFAAASDGKKVAKKPGSKTGTRKPKKPLTTEAGPSPAGEGAEVPSAERSSPSNDNQDENHTGGSEEARTHLVSDAA